MLIPKIQLNKLLDPVKLQQIVKYQGNLTVTSNDINIISRDEAGNIQLQEESETNQLLIIEPVATKITLDSVLKVLDTRFQYFKFPATIRVIDTPNVEVDLNLPELTQTINTEYTLPIIYDSKNQPNEFIRLDTTFESTWYYNDGTTISRGFKQLPFTGPNQLKPNGYTLTQDVIDILRSNNKTIKFTINTQVAWNPDNSQTFIRLVRTNPKIFRIFQSPEVNAIANTDNEAPILSITYILDTNDLAAGDFYTIEGVSGSENNLLASNAYWTIEEVDIPKTQSLSNTISYGVYVAVGDELRIINLYNNAEILKINL